MAAIITSLRHAARKSSYSSGVSTSCAELRRRLCSTAPADKDGGAGEVGFGVRTWGAGGSGQLGYPVEQLSRSLITKDSEAIPKGVPGFETSGVRTISCGADHTALVTWGGSLFTFGSDKNEKLGLGDGDRGTHRENQKGKLQRTPAKVIALDGVNVTTVACGEHHTVAVDANGVAYSWGWGGSMWSGGGALGLGSTSAVSLPTEVTTLSEQGAKVSKVSAGQNHTVFLTTDGEVWTCGSGEYGRCGNGSGGDHLVPTPLEDFEDSVIVDVKAGHAFTLALTSDGEVFGWGRNDAGQLGLGGGLTMDVYSMEEWPRIIDSLANEKVSSVAAGHSHAAAVTVDGKLFMWGMKRTLEPERMVELDGVRVVSASCGEKYTAAISDTGDLYTFGRGGHFLGHGDKKTQPQPKKVESLQGLRTAHVSCGHRHMAALVFDI